MRKILLSLTLLVGFASQAVAADNYAATAGSGLTFGAKDAAGVLYSRFIGCDNTTVSQCWAVDASGRLTALAVQSGTWTVQPGNTANTTPWLMSVSQGGNTAVVKAANTVATTDMGVVVAVANTLPPGQAAAASSSPVIVAKNSGTGSTIAGAAVGTAGTPSAEVVTVQGVTAGTPIPTSPTAYPQGAVPYTASATGTTSATAATLAGAASVTTYICGFSIRANATAAATGNAVVSGTISGSLNFTQWTAPLASGLGVTEMIFSPCVPASATNTSIVVTSAAPGSGGVVSVSAWGYKL